MLTVLCVLAVVAFLVTIFAIPGHPPPYPPLWLAVLLLALCELLRCLPVGR
jgi:hypothetical protein